MTKILYKLSNFVETDAKIFARCYISHGDTMKKRKTTYESFDVMLDNIKYAKRLIYIKYLGSFDKKK